MLNQWFYSHPTWEVAAAVCAFMLAVSLAGLYLFHRLVDWQKREHDTSMTGLSYALCGGIYAVVLAFVAVGAYETMDRSTEIAADEANSLGSLAFDSAGLPDQLGLKVRHDVDRYIDIVTRKEWPSQQAYQMEDAHYEDGWAEVRRISLDVAGFDPSEISQASVKGEMERAVDDLFAARRARLLAAHAHIPDAVWQMLIFGLLLVLVYIYLFGPHSFKIHMAVTTLTVLSIGLVFSLIIALDYPFRGDLSVDCEAYTGIQEVANRAFEQVGEKREPAEAAQHHVKD